MEKETKEQKRTNDRRKKPRHRIGRILSITLISAGILLLLFVAGIKLYTNYQQNAFIRQYESGFASAISGEGSEVTELPNPDNLMNVGDGTIDVVGILHIPAIKVKVAIGEGVDKKTLKYTVGHFEGTAMPGETGNCCIIGHRSYTWGEFFNRLGEMEIGDEVIAQYGGETFTYTVSEIFVVNPEDVWVLDDMGDSQMTLITCTPIHVATQRLIVRCNLNENE
jgi:sortase A